MGHGARHDADVRLRVGVILWLVSWVPFAVLFGATGSTIVLIWTLQIVVGLVGLAIAGTVFAAGVKSVGWRHAPGLAWRSLLHGDRAAPRQRSEP